MMEEGKWATELEILACAHLLGLDIFTFSDSRWVRFSGKNVSPSFKPSNVALYLNHKNKNHYNVVLDVNDSYMIGGESLKIDSINMKNGKTSWQSFLNKKEKRLQYKRKMYNRKYEENEEFRNQKLKKDVLRYKMDECLRMSLNEKNKERYRTDVSSKTKTKMRSTEKYRNDGVHRQSMKERSTQKYRNDDNYRQRKKTRSVSKYKLNEKHREAVKKRSINKYCFDETHKEKVKRASVLKYNTDEKFRKTLLKTKEKRYKTDEDFRRKLKENSKQNYSNPSVKRRKKENSKQTKLNKKMKLEHEEEVVSMFKRNTVRGPDFACCCCHRLLFENQVQRCEKNRYANSITAADVAELCIKNTFLHQCTVQCSESCSKSTLWICYTCHRKILSGDIPPEAATNNMHLDPVPKELSCLNSLEQHLISMHIPFMKVMALPKGGQKNIHGPVVCVPTDLKKRLCYL